MRAAALPGAPYWAFESGIAYYTSLLANGDNLILLACDDSEVAGHLVGRLRGPDSVHSMRVADLESIHIYSAHPVPARSGRSCNRSPDWRT
jgi:hypothetical protein